MIGPLISLSFRNVNAKCYQAVRRRFSCMCGSPFTPSFRVTRGDGVKSQWSGKRRSFVVINSPLSSPSLQSALKNDEVVDNAEKATRNGNLIQQYSHQRGHGKIVALSAQSSPSSPISTYLTELRHSSPMRLVPSRRTHPPHSHSHGSKDTCYEAALLHLSSYGGGLVPGDSLNLDIDVRGNGAILCIFTQGGQRIYRPGEQFRMANSWQHGGVASISQNAETPRKYDVVVNPKLCQATIQCVVEPGSTLLYLPDPTVPYYQSSFGERRELTCQYDDQSMGSIIAVDWYSCGRLFSKGMEVERWAFEYLSTRTELFVVEKNPLSPPLKKTRPALIESVIFDNKVSKSKDSTIRTPAAIAFGKTLNAIATLLLHGPTSLPVVKRAKILSRKIASTHTRVRTEFALKDDINDVGHEEAENEELELLLESFGGRVLCSITPIEKNIGQPGQSQKMSQQTHMVRILAECNEDVYRILHHCLKPCSHYLGGLEPYQDRIHSSRTVRKRTHAARRQGQAIESKQSRRDNPAKHDLDSLANHLIFGNDRSDISFSSDAWFRMFTLSDSALPVGSFAHSLGVEAAAQMKLFTNVVSNDVEESKLSESSWSMSNSASSCSAEVLSDYIHAVSCSHARFSTPLILAGYSLLVPKSRDPIVDTHQSWFDLDTYVDTLLLCNEPGRQASRDQGLGLLRIVPSFLDCTSSHHGNLKSQVTELWELIRGSVDTKINQSNSTSTSPQHLAHGHAAPIYGILSASLGISPMDSCRVFAFGAARDSVSAAVRLNLIGPTAGLSILDGVGRGAVEKGLEEGLLGMISENLVNGSSCDEMAERRDVQLDRWLRSVATCAPLVDTIQPLHDLLSLRLFKT